MVVKRLQLWSQLLLSSLVMLSCATEAWSRPKVFANYSSIEQAKQEAKQAGKVLLVDFTASWCPPCKHMDAETWNNSDVMLWLKDNAVAIQIDVDEDEKTSSKLKVDAMPTLVLFTPKSGYYEFGRQVGFLEPAELLQWLEGAKSGKSPEEIEKEQANSGEQGIWQRIGKVREMAPAEATDEYIWLWNNAGKASKQLEEVRLSLVPFEMKRLCATYPPAKAKVVAMRDAADNRKDWVILNGVLDDNARTLAWFDKTKSDPQQRKEIVELTSVLEPVLFSNSRWADAVNFLYPDPMAKLKEYYKRAEEMKHPDEHTEVSKSFDPFPSMVFTLYAAYIGAGKDADAQKIEAECLRLDDTADMREGLKNTASGMRQARAAQKPR